MQKETPTRLASDIMPPPAPKPYQNAQFVILEIPDEEQNRKVLEEIFFRMDIHYQWGVGKMPSNKPSEGHVFCWIHFHDPADLFHVGIAYQSKLQQI